MMLIFIYYMIDQFTDQNSTSNNFINIKSIQSSINLFCNVQLIDLNDIFVD